MAVIQRKEGEKTWDFVVRAFKENPVRSTLVGAGVVIGAVLISVPKVRQWVTKKVKGIFGKGGR